MFSRTEGLLLCKYNGYGEQGNLVDAKRRLCRPDTNEIQIEIALGKFHSQFSVGARRKNCQVKAYQKGWSGSRKIRERAT